MKHRHQQCNIFLSTQEEEEEEDDEKNGAREKAQLLYSSFVAKNQRMKGKSECRK